MPRNNNKNRNRNRNNNQPSVGKNVTGESVAPSDKDVEPEPSQLGDSTLSEAKDKLEQLQESVDRIKANLEQAKENKIDQAIVDEPLSSTSNDEVRSDPNQTGSADAAKKKRNRNRNRKKNAADDKDNANDSHESSPTIVAASDEFGAGDQLAGEESRAEAIDNTGQLEAIVVETIPLTEQMPEPPVDDITDVQIRTGEIPVETISIEKPTESVEEKINAEKSVNDNLVEAVSNDQPKLGELPADKHQQNDKSNKGGKKAQKQNKKQIKKDAEQETKPSVDLIELSKPEEEILEISDPTPKEEKRVEVEFTETKDIQEKPIEVKPLEAKPIEAKPLLAQLFKDVGSAASIEATPIEAKPIEVKPIEEISPDLTIIESLKPKSADDAKATDNTMQEASSLEAEKIFDQLVSVSTDAQVETKEPLMEQFVSVESKKQKNKRDKHKKAGSIESQRKPLEEIAEDSEKKSENIKDESQAPAVQSIDVPQIGQSENEKIADEIKEQLVIVEASQETLSVKPAEIEVKPAENEVQPKLSVETIEKRDKKFGIIENEEGTNTPTPSPVASQIIDPSKFIKKAIPQQEDEAAKIWRILEEASKSLEPVEIQMDDGALYFDAKPEPAIETSIGPITPMVTVDKDENEANKAAENLASILAASKTATSSKAGKTKDAKKSPKMANKNEQNLPRKMAQAKSSEAKEKKEPPKEMIPPVAEKAPSPPPRKSSSPDKRSSTIEMAPLFSGTNASPVEKSPAEKLPIEKSPSPVGQPSLPVEKPSVPAEKPSLPAEKVSLQEERASSPTEIASAQKPSTPTEKAPVKTAKASSATKASAPSKKSGEKSQAKKSPTPSEKAPSPPKRAEKASSPTKATSKKSTTPPKQSPSSQTVAPVPLDKPPSPPEKSAPDEKVASTQIDELPLDISILPNAIETDHLQQIDSKNVQGSDSVPSVEPSMADAAESLGPENTTEETIVTERKSKSPTDKIEKSDVKPTVSSRSRAEAMSNARTGTAQPTSDRVKKSGTSIESNKKSVSSKVAAVKEPVTTARRLSDEGKANKTNAKQSTIATNAKAPVTAKVNSKPSVPPKPDHLTKGTTKKTSATLKSATAKPGAVDKKIVLATDPNSPYDSEEDYIEYKFVPRQVFISTICQSCKTPTKAEQRTFCPKCQMVAYCCAEHVLADEPLHKDLCGSIQEIAKKRGRFWTLFRIFAMFYIVFLRILLGGHIYNNARILNDSDYRSLRVHTLNMCENILKRPLQTFEREILLFPRLCSRSSCREWRQNLLVDCPNCTQVRQIPSN